MQTGGQPDRHTSFLTRKRTKRKIIPGIAVHEYEMRTQRYGAAIQTQRGQEGRLAYDRKKQGEGVLLDRQDGKTSVKTRTNDPNGDRKDTTG